MNALGLLIAAVIIAVLAVILINRGSGAGAGPAVPPPGSGGHPMQGGMTKAPRNVRTGMDWMSLGQLIDYWQAEKGEYPPDIEALIAENSIDTPWFVYDPTFAYNPEQGSFSCQGMTSKRGEREAKYPVQPGAQ